MVGDLAGLRRRDVHARRARRAGAHDAARDDRRVGRREDGRRHAAGKNLVGAFHPPAAVLIADVELLATLPAGAPAAPAWRRPSSTASSPTRATSRGRIDAALREAPLATARRRSRRSAGWSRAASSIKAAVVARRRARGRPAEDPQLRAHASATPSSTRAAIALLHGEAVGDRHGAGGAARRAAGDRRRRARRDASRPCSTRVRAAERRGRPALTPRPCSPPRAATRRRARGAVEYALPDRASVRWSRPGARWAVPVPDALVLEVLASELVALRERRSRRVTAAAARAPPPRSRRVVGPGAAIGWVLLAGLLMLARVGQVLQPATDDAEEADADLDQHRPVLVMGDVRHTPIRVDAVPPAAVAATRPTGPTRSAPDARRSLRELPKPFAALRLAAGPLIMPRLSLPRSLSPSFPALRSMLARAKPGSRCTSCSRHTVSAARPGAARACARASSPPIRGSSRSPATSSSTRAAATSGRFMVEDTGSAIQRHPHRHLDARLQGRDPVRHAGGRRGARAAGR